MSITAPGSGAPVVEVTVPRTNSTSASPIPS